MANKFEKGQHLFFLMSGGKTQLDSQQKPRYYLNRDRARQYAKGDSEIVEYAPVKHGVWEKTGYAYLLRCSACHDCYIDEDWLDGKKWNFCPECGAKMDGGDDDETDHV